MTDVDGRVWESTHGRHVGAGELDLDTVEEIVDEHADRLERTVACAAFVHRSSERVTLRCVIPRRADREILERALQDVNVMIAEALIDAVDGGEG